ncbi:glycosyltransferase family 4 protein [Phaeacidiphilus oryzae]|uniref:glycosyltransferase family 4 protein n=1 Tax=Phaeacidiphilus oryzae TaxID=348818 RepID=UPI00055FB3B6|nr:glycosyltransferase family 4 protein [Phaeacidiphilus oryzae]
MNALLARTSQGLLARSEAEEEAALRLGAPRENIRLIPSGVDTELFHPEAVPMPPRQRGRRPQAAEPKPGAGKGAQSDATAAAAAKAATAGAKSGGATRPDGSDSPRVLCLDGGGPARATAIAAIRAIPEARLTVAGGTAHEPVRRGRVELLGPVPHTAVPRLLADADVLVSTPDRDSGGSAALEAMACGVPVVATDVGALSDLVLDQITGLLVPPRRPDLVARAIRRVLHRSSWQLALGTAGRDRACARHDWDRVATETERFYLERIEAATAAAAA